MSKLQIYQDMRQRVLGCQNCDLGCEGVLDGYDPHVVGQGNLDANIMFVAEAPGKHETIAQQPLTTAGVSGAVYESILSSLGLTRDDVYTTNTVMCRPPDNRDPAPYEVKACRDHLRFQMDLVNPKLVVTFGRFAALAFLNGIKITKDHGKIVKSDKFDVRVYPVYHPAYYRAYASAKQREEFKRDIFRLKKIARQITLEEEA